ncbi:MAG: YgfZ/GcvT domain-containing protein [Gemmatimonadales bacterium]
MPSELSAAEVATVVKGDLPEEMLKAVVDGAVVAKADVTTIELSGQGALQCMQGILTNDIEGPGSGAFVYGAILTSKGKIISDMWVARENKKLVVFCPSVGSDKVLETFGRTIPPRLAQFTNVTSQVEVLRLVGRKASTVAVDAGLKLPNAGRIRIDGARMIARPTYEEPFEIQVACPKEEVAACLASLEDAGAIVSDASALDVARILLAWPRLGAEIDGKTLPQEVRFDQLAGVSYSKGCYTGQETVARIHFRGHVNQRVVGLLWDDSPDPSENRILRDGKLVGRLTSVAWLGIGDRHIGLCKLRKEVAVGCTVTAGGALARTVDLPMEAL